MSKTKSLILFIILFIIGYLINNPYRDYIFSNQINDFGIADSGYSLFAVPLIFLFGNIFNVRFFSKVHLNLFTIYFIYVMHEMISYLIPYFGVFDFIDIAALTIGYLITIVVVFLPK